MYCKMRTQSLPVQSHLTMQTLGKLYVQMLCYISVSHIFQMNFRHHALHELFEQYPFVDLRNGNHQALCSVDTQQSSIFCAGLFKQQWNFGLYFLDDEKTSGEKGLCGVWADTFILSLFFIRCEVCIQVPCVMVFILCIKLSCTTVFYNDACILGVSMGENIVQGCLLWRRGTGERGWKIC